MTVTASYKRGKRVRKSFNKCLLSMYYTSGYFKYKRDKGKENRSNSCSPGPHMPKQAADSKTNKSKRSGWTAISSMDAVETR